VDRVININKDNHMIVAGVMSGTSADGINIALVRITEPRGNLTFKLLAHAEYAYPKKIRAAILAAMNATSVNVADLARLNFLLGNLYAEAILETQRESRAKIDLVGCHGQTLYHQGEPQPFLGRKVAATWQTGEAAIIAAKVTTPVVSDFRPADMAAGGKGAPLVPYLDYALFRDPRLGRIVQNIGGIANFTAIPAAATLKQTIAFDTGPGNMVIDAVTQELFARPFDRDGKTAAKGKIQYKVIQTILRRDYFRKQPPKTAGREEFGREFVRDFLKLCQGCRKEDVIATATALTAHSITEAIRQFAIPTRSSPRKSTFHEMIVSGGGAKNLTLMRMLREQLTPQGLQLITSDELGLPSEAKEAVAFAVLAYETWHRRPSNVPSATGALRPAVLGKISYP
jgi:anhydro-N-acetylmuramic acid kinase